MWGQVVSAKFNAKRNGIIPTRVGTRHIKARTIPVQKDHPHACGDKASPDSGLVFSEGSSPRVWGQVEYTGERHAGGGIIPTRVGTSIYSDGYLLHSEDHPHACGDKHLCSYCTPCYQGSSPRVWGQGNRHLSFYR